MSNSAGGLLETYREAGRVGRLIGETQRAMRDGKGKDGWYDEKTWDVVYDKVLVAMDELEVFAVGVNEGLFDYGLADRMYGGRFLCFYDSTECVSVRKSMMEDSASVYCDSVKFVERLRGDNDD